MAQRWFWMYAPPAHKNAAPFYVGASSATRSVYGYLECGSLLPLFWREPARASPIQAQYPCARPASWPELKRQQAAALQSACGGKRQGTASRPPTR
jgi:hypothetical protein